MSNTGQQVKFIGSADAYHAHASSAKNPGNIYFPTNDSSIITNGKTYGKLCSLKTYICEGKLYLKIDDEVSNLLSEEGNSVALFRYITQKVADTQKAADDEDSEDSEDNKREISFRRGWRMYGMPRHTHLEKATGLISFPIIDHSKWDNFLELETDELKFSPLPEHFLHIKPKVIEESAIEVGDGDGYFDKTMYYVQWGRHKHWFRYDYDYAKGTGWSSKHRQRTFQFGIAIVNTALYREGKVSQAMRSNIATFTICYRKASTEGQDIYGTWHWMFR